MPRTRGIVAGATAWAATGLAFAVSAFSLPIDDFWLSLASAREIALGADPSRAITLTWTPMQADALNPQWGAQVILGLGGTLGWALAVNAALIAAGLGLTALRVAQRASSRSSAIALLLAIGVIAPHLLARPQSFSIALLPLALLCLERARGRLWLPLAYGLLIAVWANLHGAFVIGQLAAAAAFIGSGFDRRSGPMIMALTALLALVAPLANPAGPALLAYAFTQPASDVIRAISVEWQPAWPWIPVATAYWAYLLLLVPGRLAPPRGRPGELVLLLLLALLAASSIRHIPWFVLASAPLLASDVDRMLAARPSLGRAIGQVGGPLGDARAPIVVAAALVVTLVFQSIRPALPESLGRLTPDEPVAVAEALANQVEAGSRTPILNEQVWGGYLAWRLGDRVRTAMDGRIEIRSRQTWVEYFALMHGEQDPAARLDRAGVRWAALAPHRESLVRELQDAGWALELATDRAVLLRAP